jgi:hypothetical protein
VGPIKGKVPRERIHPERNNNLKDNVSENCITLGVAPSISLVHFRNSASLDRRASPAPKAFARRKSTVANRHEYSKEHCDWQVERMAAGSFCGEGF